MSEDSKKKKITALDLLKHDTKKPSDVESLLKSTIDYTDTYKHIKELISFPKYDYSNLSNISKIVGGNYEESNSDSIEKQLELQQEINDLKRKLNSLVKDKELNVTELTELKTELQAKEKISHILPRISEQARQKLFSSEEFREEFKDARNCSAVVVSIDIRRSTELMLKARKPELFSQFITQLTDILSQVIISNFGVFDKFTGDGILAFFPTFYSGEDAIIRAIKAAEECHSVFKEHYNNSRKNFNVFIKDVGLGIGIDFGNVTLVNSRNELTVVGIPVVYACRMSGAKAGETILNQPAMEEVERLIPTQVKFSETEIIIKNEGTALAYKVDINPSAYNLSTPEWTIIESEKSEDV